MCQTPHPMSLSRLLVLVVLALSLATGCRSTAPRAEAPAAARAHTVLLVSIDGMPASMLGSGTMPTLDGLAGAGVRAAWLKPSFPTLTFPNHYTLVTGLRPDRHGIVHNTMQDPVLGRFVSKEASGRDGRWWGGEPIWVTYQRQGGRSATMFWPGSEAEIAGARPTEHVPFDGRWTPRQRVDQVLAWLDQPAAQRPGLVTLYFEQFDVAAHANGAGSPQARDALRAIDAALAQLLAGLEARGLREGTDLVIVSDHGMIDVPRAQVTILDDVLPATTYTTPWVGMVVGIVPNPGHEDAVARAFVRRHAHFTCWDKRALPAEWRYGTHPRITPIVCVTDPGWSAMPRAARLGTAPVRGEHGFAPEAEGMRAVFVADGPSFRDGVQLPPFDNVDVYPLLARLLGVTPAPNDGALDAVAPALRD